MRTLLFALFAAGCTQAPPAPPSPAPPAEGEAPGRPPGTIELGPLTFERGASTDDRVAPPEEKPAWSIQLTRAFALDATEVTRGAFARFVDATGHVTAAERAGWGMIDNGHERARDVSWRNPPFPQRDDHPVVLVSFDDAAAFANWRSADAGLTPCYRGRELVADCSGWRLPTEAEWEAAARVGRTGPTHDPLAVGGCEAAPGLDEEAWHCGNAEHRTHPVGLKRPSPSGAYDLLGNAWEWVHDGWAPHGSTAVDPRDDSDDEDRVIRGGGWGTRPRDCRVTLRQGDEPGKAFDNLGFRLARTLPEAP